MNFFKAKNKNTFKIVDNSFLKKENNEKNIHIYKEEKK
jgi:hypothetical protein